MNDVDHLRDEVARRLFMERRKAGEGVGAYSPSTRPPGSPPLTPITGGGRGASPESSRATSPRSVSPRGAAKCAGKSGGEERWGTRAVAVVVGGGGGSRGDSLRPPSPAWSTRSGEWEGQMLCATTTILKWLSVYGVFLFLELLW